LLRAPRRLMVLRVLVSVLLPVRNDARHLWQALASIHRQTRPVDEVVAVDDASGDLTHAVLKTWSSRLPMRIVLGSGGGIARALNTGLAVVQGDVVVRMDADDVMHPRRVAAQLEHLAQHPHLGVVGTEVVSFPSSRVSAKRQKYDHWLSSLHTPEEHARDMFVEAPLAHPTAMIRSALLRSVGGYQVVPWPEDYDVWLRLHRAGAAFGKPQGVLHFWRERPERLSRRHPDYTRDNIRRGKLHHLVEMFGLRVRPIVIVGAGIEGKAAGRVLLGLGAHILAHVDADPRKIGGRLAGEGGVRVLAPSEVPRLMAQTPRPLAVVAIGTAGHKPQLRAELQGWGLTEGGDAVLVA